MGREGAAVNNAVANTAHDILATGNDRERVPIADGLGKGAEIGPDIEELLHAALRHAEPCLYLIDDQEHVIAVADFTHVLHVLRIGRDRTAVTHNRLHQERADFIVFLLQQVLECIRVIHRHEVE